MGRLYIAPINIATTTLQCDFVELIPATELPVSVHELLITTDDAGDSAEVQQQLRVNRYTGTYTTGDGGAVAAVPLDEGDNADGATVKVGSLSSGTLAATGTGTQEEMSKPYMNSRAGIHWIFTPETRPIIKGTDAWVVGLAAAPAATTAYAGHIIFEEIV